MGEEMTHQRDRSARDPSADVANRILQEINHNEEILWYQSPRYEAVLLYRLLQALIVMPVIVVVAVYLLLAVMRGPPSGLLLLAVVLVVAIASFAVAGVIGRRHDGNLEYAATNKRLIKLDGVVDPSPESMPWSAVHNVNSDVNITDTIFETGDVVVTGENDRITCRFLTEEETAVYRLKHIWQRYA
jgi:hypothetical protein